MSTDTATTSESALNVTGMDCASCVAHVEKAAKAVPGVTNAIVNLARGRATVQFDPSATNLESIAGAITEAGYPSTPTNDSAQSETDRLQHQHEHAQAWLRRAKLGILLWLPVELTHWILLAAGKHHVIWLEWIALITSTVALVMIGSAFYKNAWSALKRRTTDMDVLISMGASVAYFYSLIAFIGYLAGIWRLPASLYFMESTGLLALISLGHWLEAHARTSAGKAIHELLNLAPATALRVKNLAQETEEIPVAELHLDDKFLVRPGDRIATDGIVTTGQSSVDESMITGESLPVPRKPGEEVLGGTINHDGRLVVRVTRTGSATALSQIVQLVEKAQNSKPPVQKLADKISAIFVPSVLGFALLTGITWYLVGTAKDWPAVETWSKLANAVCSVLIIACPCALGLAVPAALMVGTGLGAKRGILVRDIDALQKAESITTIVLDKTGTITQGKPVVAKVETFADVDESEALRLAASIDQFSAHPLAKAIVRAAKEKNLKLSTPDDFQNDSGKGVTAQIDQTRYLLGSSDLIPQAHGFSRGTGTHIYLATPEKLLAVFLLTDELKPDSKQAIAELHRMNLQTLLLTGDRSASAKPIADEVGIQNLVAEVKPEQKKQTIESLQATGQKIAMVGDGINDAPALAQADLGIAIGSGSDVAKETGDIVLVSGSLTLVPVAIKLSRATMRTIRQNLFFAFIYNALAIPLAACGLLNPLVAAACMAFSDVSVIGNALRLRRAKID